MRLHNFAPFPSGIPQCEKTQIAGEMIEMVDFRMLGQTWPNMARLSDQFDSGTEGADLLRPW